MFYVDSLCNFSHFHMKTIRACAITQSSPREGRSEKHGAIRLKVIDSIFPPPQSPVPLDGEPALWHATCSPRFCVAVRYLPPSPHQGPGSPPAPEISPTGRHSGGQIQDIWMIWRNYEVDLWGEILPTKLGPHKPTLIFFVSIFGTNCCSFVVASRPASDPIGVKMGLGDRVGVGVSGLCLAAWMAVLFAHRGV